MEREHERRREEEERLHKEVKAERVPYCGRVTRDAALAPHI